jgi:hypothetical protein
MSPFYKPGAGFKPTKHPSCPPPNPQDLLQDQFEAIAREMRVNRQGAEVF